LIGGLKKATGTTRIPRMPGREHSELRRGEQTNRSSALPLSRPRETPNNDGIGVGLAATA
jgi:hypothetical protein